MTTIILAFLTLSITTGLIARHILNDKEPNAAKVAIPVEHILRRKR